MIIFTDDLVHYDARDVQDSSESVDKEYWKKELNKLKQEMVLLGFRLNERYEGNNDYLWVDAIIDEDGFSREKLDKMTKLWGEYNNKMRNELLKV